MAALAMARELAATSTATIHALDVVSLPTIVYGGYVGPSYQEAIEVPLERARQRLSELPDVTGRAVPGLAGEELAAFGDEVDILVIGSRGYGPVQRLVLGSTSNYLARHARCPLLVLPRSA
jgi:nucleotide-binding universal stress UspA family protein